MGQLRVSLAGAVAFETGSRRVGPTSFRGRQLPLVAAILVLQRAHPVSVDFLAEQLWPDQELPDRWRVAVRGLVSQFRHLVADAGVDHDVAVAGSRTYTVDLGDVVVDVESVPGHLERSQVALREGDLDGARDHASAARAITSRPVLPGIEGPWLTEVRDELLRNRLDALDLLAECRSRAGEHTDAAAAAREAVDLDPYRESAWRRLLRVQADAGDPAAAMRSYQACRDLLRDEFGVPPSAETQALYAGLIEAIPDDELLLVQPGPRAVAEGQPIVPYRGLLPFDRDDTNLFFGRDSAVQELLDRLGDHAAVVVTGPSGSGKSSLVRAGLLPALAHGGLPDADTWLTATVLPGADPVAALGRALDELTTAGERDERAAARLARDPTALSDLVDATLTSRGAAPSSRLLVVVDQAEELFTVCTNPTAREQVLAALHHATRARSSRLRVVLTLRADFYAEATTLPELAELLSTCQYVVPPLDGDGIEAAIVGPARLAGVRLEDGLVGRILEDVLGEPGMLPLLQHALLELWEHRDEHVLTHAAYGEVGGVTGALGHRAEAVFTALDPEARSAARRLLLRAVLPGVGTGDTRRAVQVRDLAEAGTVDAVVERFISARLLTGTADPGTGDRVVELAHEALITGWPRLSGWVDENRAVLVAHQRLAQSATAWTAHGRHPDYLLAGEPLGDGLRVRDRLPELVNPTEGAFLDASVTREEQATRRRARQRRLVLASLSAAAVIALVFGAISLVQRNSAIREAEAARARALIGASQTQLGEDQDLALLLALEAARIGGGDDIAADTLGALHRALLNHRIVATIDGVASGAKFLDDDRLVLFAALGEDQPPVVWDLAADAPVVELEDPSTIEQFWDVAVSRDGRTYVETYVDGTEAKVYDLVTGQVAARVPIVDGQQDAPSLSADGSTLAVVNMDLAASRRDSVSVYDLPSARERYRFDVEGTPFRTQVSPDGRLLAVADAASATVRLFDLTTGEPAGEVTGHPGSAQVTGVRFGPEGETLTVLVGPPFRLRVHDLASGEVVVEHDLRGSAPFDLCQSHDGRTVGVLTPGEVIEVFDLDRATRSSLPADGIEGAPSCSPDGTRIAGGSRQNRIHLWDVTATGAAETWSVAAPSPWTGVWAGEGVVTVDQDGTLRRYEDGVEVARSGVVARSVEQGWTLVASPDGRHVVTNSRRPPRTGPEAYPLWGEGRLVVYDAVTLEPLTELTPGGFPLGFSPDATRFLMGSLAGGVVVADVATGDVVQQLDIDLAANPGGAFLPDGRHVVVRHFRTAEIHDLQTGTTVATACIDQFGLDVAVSPDGQLLAAQDWGNETIEVFDLELLREVSPGTFDCTAEGPHPSDDALVTILPRQDRATFAFSADSTRLVTASPRTGDVTVWDRAANQVVVRIPHDGIAGGAVTTPDGEHVVVTLTATDGNSAVRLYTLDPARLIAMAADRITTGASPADCERYDLADHCDTDS